jgi:ATP-dependent 26S proteasome regulatory subunit
MTRHVALSQKSNPIRNVGPTTGKTHLARAIASSTPSSVLIINGPELSSATQRIMAKPSLNYAKNTYSTEELQTLASQMHGYIGADISAVVRQAGTIAIKCWLGEGK